MGSMVKIQFGYNKIMPVKLWYFDQAIAVYKVVCVVCSTYSVFSFLVFYKVNNSLRKKNYRMRGKKYLYAFYLLSDHEIMFSQYLPKNYKALFLSKFI